MHQATHSHLYQYRIEHCWDARLDRWLDLGVADTQCWDLSLEDRIAAAFNSPFTGLGGALEQAFARGLTASRVVHSRMPPPAALPPESFRMVLLDEPRRRFISAARALGLLPLEPLPPADTAVLAKGLLHSGQHQHRRWLDNHLVRALAACRLGPLAFEVDRAEPLLPIAIEALKQQFEFVGLRQQGCTLLGRALAHALGRPDPAIADDTANPLDNDAFPIPEPLLAQDDLLYAEAAKLFERHTTAAAPWSQQQAKELSRHIVPLNRNGPPVFSVRGPMMVCGVHGRDAAGSDNCRLWSGPSPRMTIWIAVPKNTRITAEIRVHGYAHERQRETLRIECDGRVQPHRFESLEGYRDLIAVDCKPQQSILGLSVILDETLSGPDLGDVAGDTRRRGISFDRYGWRLGR
ncbi:MAG: hypothetical protein Q7J29_05480 [Stagnimonas sp.]|nr:hypothetical protein [Stagnimonas sp.]